MLIRWIVCVMLAACAHAQVSLPPQFSSGMVLQRGEPAPIWGEGAPGEIVRVRLGDEVRETVAGDDGSWSVTLDARAAGGPHAIVIEQAGASIELDDVLFGDVWLCSGQSNMQWALRLTDRFATDGPASADDGLRLFSVERRVAAKPAERLLEGEWAAASPETTADFSAGSYYFGRELRRELGIPIGLIHSSWGGTRAEAWTPIDDIAAGPPMVSKLMDHWRGRLPADTGEVTVQQPGALYNAMIHPLRDRPIAGVIWYHGEANAARAEQYRELMPLLIESWRGVFGRDDLPFGMVQLASFKARVETPTETPWAELRDAQLHTARTLPDVGLACAIDIGEANDIHPRNKHDVGVRLARWALGEVYGLDVVPSGPVASSHAVEADQMRIVFEHADGLTTADDAAPLAFTIAGEDRVFHNAQAEIQGRSVVVRSDAVPSPVAVRYAWADNPAVNLVNAEGLPAVPFRTDGWPGVTAGRTAP
jgi:sialate O-acetylesterase